MFHPLKLRWLLLTSVLLGVIAILAPRYVHALDSVDAAIETTIVLGVAYIPLLIVAVAKYHLRGLILLVTLPIILYWPVALAALAFACIFGNNGKACP